MLYLEGNEEKLTCFAELSKDDVVENFNSGLHCWLLLEFLRTYLYRTGYVGVFVQHLEIHTFCAGVCFEQVWELILCYKQFSYPKKFKGKHNCEHASLKW